MKKLSPEDLDILKLSMIKSRIATQNKLSDIKKSAYKTKPPTNKRRANVETTPNVMTKSDVAKKQRIDTRLQSQDQISNQVDKAYADLMAGVVDQPVDTRTTREKLNDIFEMRKVALANAMKLFGDKQEAYEFMNQSFITEPYIKFFNKNFPAISRGLKNKTDLLDAKTASDYINKFIMVFDKTKGLGGNTSIDLADEIVSGIKKASNSSPLYEFIYNKGKKHTAASLDAGRSPTTTVTDPTVPYFEGILGVTGMNAIKSALKQIASDYSNRSYEAIKQQIALFIDEDLTNFDDPSIQAATQTPISTSATVESILKLLDNQTKTGSSSGSSMGGTSSASSAPPTTSYSSDPRLASFSVNAGVINGLSSLTDPADQIEVLNEYDLILRTKAASLPAIDTTVYEFMRNIYIALSNLLERVLNNDPNGYTDLEQYYSDEIDDSPGIDYIAGSLGLIDDYTQAYNNFMSRPTSSSSGSSGSSTGPSAPPSAPSAPPAPPSAPSAPSAPPSAPSGSTSSTGSSNPIQYFNVNNDVLNFFRLTIPNDKKIKFFELLNNNVKKTFKTLYVAKIPIPNRHIQFDEYSKVYQNLTDLLLAYKNVYTDPTEEPKKLNDIEDYFNTIKLEPLKKYTGTILEASILYVEHFNDAYKEFISKNPIFSTVSATPAPAPPAPAPTAPAPSGLVSRPVATAPAAPASTPGRTLVAYDFCTDILNEAQGVKDDFYNYWVARQTSWQPGVTDQNILIGQVATRYTQLIDYIQQYDNETNPTEKKRIQNEMLNLNRDSFFVDESNKSLRDYDQSVLDEINSFLADMESYADTVMLRSITGTATAATSIVGNGLNSYFSKVKGQKQMMTKRSQLSKPISPPVQTFSGLGSYFSKIKQKQSKYIRF